MTIGNQTISKTWVPIIVIDVGIKYGIPSGKAIRLPAVETEAEAQAKAYDGFRARPDAIAFTIEAATH